jgi:chromosome segregation ATPase
VVNNDDHANDDDAKAPSKPAQLLLEDAATWERRVAEAEAAKQTAVVAYNHMSTTVTKLVRQKTKLVERVAKAEAKQVAIATRAIRAVDKRKEETKWAVFKQQRAEEFYAKLEQDVDNKYISLEELERNYIPRAKLFEQMAITKAEYDEMERKYDEADVQAGMDRFRIQQLEETLRTRNKEVQRLQGVETENRMLRDEVAVLQSKVATQESGRKRAVEERLDEVPVFAKKSKIAI